jgi:hypothetical protein
MIDHFIMLIVSVLITILMLPPLPLLFSVVYLYYKHDSLVNKWQANRIYYAKYGTIIQPAATGSAAPLSDGWEIRSGIMIVMRRRMMMMIDDDR